MSSKQIARRLGISPLTVRTHRRTVFAALAVHSIAELARLILDFDQAPTPSQ